MEPSDYITTTSMQTDVFHGIISANQVTTNHNNITIIEHDGKMINLAETISELTLQVNTMVDLIEMMLETGNFDQIQKRSFAVRMTATKMLQKLSK